MEDYPVAIILKTISESWDLDDPDLIKKWRAVREDLLKIYPEDHESWGGKQGFPYYKNLKKSPYSFMKDYLNTPIKSWEDIERHICSLKKALSDLHIIGSSISEALFLFVKKESKKIANRQNVNIDTKPVQKVIQDAIDQIESLYPAEIWTAVCDKLLTTYPEGHFAWGDFPVGINTYDSVKNHSNKAAITWKDIEFHTYEIAMDSCEHDIGYSLITEKLFKFVQNESQKRAIGTEKETSIESIQKIIKKSCDQIENLNPTKTWKAICKTLLSTYPEDHIAWGQFPVGAVTYKSLKRHSKKIAKSWKDIEIFTYHIQNSCSINNCGSSPIAESLFLFVGNRSSKRTIGNDEDKCISAIEINIIEACHQNNDLTPDKAWKTVCDQLLSLYPVDHIAWGDFPVGAITHDLVEEYSKNFARSWDDIQNYGYLIAKHSSRIGFCAPIAETLRGIYAKIENSTKVRIKKTRWKMKGACICKLCWRLAPLGGKSEFCDIHLPDNQTGNKEYQKAHRQIAKYKKIEKQFADFDSPHKELINSIGPYNRLLIPDHSPETLAKLAHVYPRAIAYISKIRNKNPLDINQLIEGLVEDSATTPEGRIAVQAEMENMKSRPASIMGHLKACELWLKTYEDNPVGGKRTGSGRDQNITIRLSNSKNDILTDLRNQAMTKTEIAKKYGVSRSTIYEILKKEAC